MALRRFTRAVDGSIPMQALLYDDEELLASQESVGIYDGLQKSPDHQKGIVHLTTHRLFYIDAQKSTVHSFALDLGSVTKTEHYAGLFKSSPKVTLHLTNSTGQGGVIGNTYLNQPASSESWECEVCAYRNPPGLSPAAARICGLCGVPRTALPAAPHTVATGSSKQAPHPNHLSSSLPSSSTPSALSSSASLANTPPSSDSRVGRPSSIACPACTFLNHPSLPYCEICGTALPKPHKVMKSAPSSRPASPDPDDEEGETANPSNRMVKISFRKGGDKPFYAVLKRCLKSQAWDLGASTNNTANASADGDTYGQSTVGRSGISGILRTVETSAQGRESHMKDALQDLEALMVKAKDMVKLAAELNERLTASSSTAASNNAASPYASSATLVPSTEPEEATFIRSSLSQLGLQMENTPVTLDMMKDERKWFEELARELARVLQGSSSSAKDSANSGGIMKERGIIALDEVWGSWNRARGVALIPPSTFLQVIPHLPSWSSPPIQARSFASGLQVLHTPPYTRAAFAARLSGFLVLAGPRTTVEVALEEAITIGLAAEMIEDVETNGDICRDDAADSIAGGGSGTGVEVRWWLNLFVGYTWDGHG